MDGSRVVYLVSLGAHVVGGVALAAIKVKPAEEIVQLEMEMIEQEKEEEKEEEPEPEPEPEPLPQPKAAPQPAPQAEAAPPPAPDFGFKIGPSTGGPGGVAVPTKAPAPVVKAVPKQLGPAPKAEGTAEAVADAKAKPLPGAIKKPVYTPEATAAGIEGKVRLEITVDEAGNVVDVKVLEGLGHGLDEAAVASVRDAKFSPAIQGGKAVRSTFTLGIRFVL